MKQTTVTDLHAALSEAIAVGRGSEPVKIMHVTNGVTTTQDVVYVGASEPYDGSVFWVVGQKTHEQPCFGRPMEKQMAGKCEHGLTTKECYVCASQQRFEEWFLRCSHPLRYGDRAAASIAWSAHVRPVGKRFRAAISVNAKPKHIGYFATAEEAFEAAKAASIKYRGEFSAHLSRT